MKFMIAIVIYLIGIIPSWFLIAGMTNASFAHEFPDQCNAGFSEVRSAPVALAWPLADGIIWAAYDNGRYGWIAPWYDAKDCQ